MNSKKPMKQVRPKSLLVGVFCLVNLVAYSQNQPNAITIKNISVKGGDKWEKGYGFARAKVIEYGKWSHVIVSNTSSWDSTGKVVGISAGEQMEQVILNMKSAIEKAGGSLSDIVETTFYVTTFDTFSDLAKVHVKYFGPTQPATTLITVPSMSSTEILVEGSCTAIIVKEK